MGSRSCHYVNSERFKNYYKHIKPVSFQLKEVDEEFVVHELNNLNISTGLDGIPARFWHCRSH